MWVSGLIRGAWVGLLFLKAGLTVGLGWLRVCMGKIKGWCGFGLGGLGMV